MRKIKALFLHQPEILLILALIFYWGSAGIVLNPIAIVLIALLVFQIVFKNRVLGLIIPSVLILTCLYMLLALTSEFNEFPTFNAEARELLFVGLAFFLSTIFVSVLMINKYNRIRE